LEVIALISFASNKKSVGLGIGIFLIMSFLLGCAEDLKSAKKDPFFDQWSTLAENSKGHSPAAEPKKINLAALEAKQAHARLTGLPAKKLPTKQINLSMRQADLKSVLRALAKSVDINLLVKNDLKGEINVDFRGVPWDQAFTGLLRTHGLSYLWEGDIIRVMTVEDMEQDLKHKVQLRDMNWLEPLMPPVVVSIDYADAKKLMETLQDFLTKDKDGKPRGSVKVDEHSNSLVISAIAQDLSKMIPIIERLDRPTPQILIKANIVETTKNVARDLGIMWGGMYKGNIGGTDHYITPGGSAGTGDPMSGLYSATQAKGIGAQGFAGNFPISGLASAAGAGSLGLIFGTIGGNLLEVQLQALQKDSKLNILSSPSITTLDNQKAFTENGSRVPYATLDTSVTPPTRTIKFEDVVLRLEITPHVIDGKNLKMIILVKKDEVDPINHLSDGTPFIIKKQTQTVLIVKNGETIVISGLTKQTKSDGETGWPWLKEIPVLGWLFKADSKSDAMEEVLIFITPHILQVPGSENKASEANLDQVTNPQSVVEQKGAGNN
jgi:type IV pilus assembly protein PilQ